MTKEMTEKYYDYEHIDTILDGAVKVVKLCQEVGISNVRYDIRSDTLPYNCYDVWVQHSLDNYNVNISIKSHNKYDCYEISKRDYSIKFSYTFDFKKEREKYREKYREKHITDIEVGEIEE